MKPFDETLDHIIDLAHQGMSKEELLAKFPDYQSEIEELWEIIHKLSLAKAQLLPRRDVLAQAINVTNSNSKRYDKRQSLITNWLGEIMNKAKVLVPLGAALVVAVIVLAARGNNPVANVAGNLGNLGAKPTVANGTPDNAVNAVVQEANDDESVAAGEDQTANQVANDGASVGIGDSVDENNF